MTLADFGPTASWDALRLRAKLMRRIRDFFAERDFLEVETPLLSRDSVIDRHLDPLSVTLFHDPRDPKRGERYWLQTSPEFGMKRLLAAGSPSIYQITRAFRGGETGPLHNPEFTMVEWYGVGDDYAAGMTLLSDLAERLLERGPARRLIYRDAFRTFAQVDPFTADVVELRHVVKSNGIDVEGASHERDYYLDLLLTRLVEPRLGLESPTILHDYPATQSALARTRVEGDVALAERFELYVDGVELANGYHELLDAAVLKERNRQGNRQRLEDGKFALPEESRLLSAMEKGLPSCAGCALGFDRLVMVAMKAKSIREVLSFPIDRA